MIIIAATNIRINDHYTDMLHVHLKKQDRKTRPSYYFSWRILKCYNMKFVARNFYVDLV